MIVWCVYLSPSRHESFVCCNKNYRTLQGCYIYVWSRPNSTWPADSSVLSSDVSLVTGGSQDYKRPNRTYTAHAAGSFVFLSVYCVCSSTQICCLNSSQSQNRNTPTSLTCSSFLADFALFPKIQLRSVSVREDRSFPKQWEENNGLKLILTRNRLNSVSVTLILKSQNVFLPV